jgi:hypothetical protein
MGVLMGVYPGSWMCNKTDICHMGLTSSAGSLSFGLLSLGISLMKIVVGKYYRKDEDNSDVS